MGMDLRIWIISVCVGTTLGGFSSTTLAVLGGGSAWEGQELLEVNTRGDRAVLGGGSAWEGQELLEVNINVIGNKRLSKKTNKFRRHISENKGNGQAYRYDHGQNIFPILHAKQRLVVQNVPLQKEKRAHEREAVEEGRD